ncbi:hypothetical protein [Primorskyibacter flagellatus]|jgi:hypothetical protein|uniref:hypothetical protein n=1 Tax=Primorskyibacter flagellatus TaxID=1387277 RepID=UPI004032D522|tara:strand:- start:34935 stop:35420 length:486 start_codon:yes stop_codon:yes gene_type:complete
MGFSETGMTGSHDGGFSPKFSGHGLSLRRFEKHGRNTLSLAHECGYRHVDDDLTWGNALDPAHHPDTLVQLDDAYVVVAAPFGLSAHDCCGVDPSLAACLLPRNRGAMTMGTQDSREKVIGPAVVALGQQDLSLCQRALEKLVWSYGVLHRRSPSSDPVFV